MNVVLTAVAAKSLTDTRAAAFFDLLSQIVSPLASGAPSWLSLGKALDIPLTTHPDASQMSQWREAVALWQVDLLVTDMVSRRKTLLLADMDSTIVVGETLDDLAAHVGIGPEVAAITAQAMNGELNFAQALNARIRLLAGLDTGVIDTIVSHTQLTPGAKTLVQTMKAHGATCVLVSGGFTRFTQVVAAQCGFDRHVANVLDVKNGKLTGQVIPPIIDKNTKLAVLQDTLTNLGLDATHALTVGDGANDMPMLAAAGLGVGFYPKPVVLNATSNIIVHGDLTALLFAQGLKEVDWIN